MGEPYKISLGVDVDVSDIQSQINEAANKVKPIPIRIEIENINDIKKEIQSLGNTKTSKSSLTLNTESLEASLKDVSSSIKEIRTSIGTLDNKSGMKSLLSSINQISAALEKASNQFESLNANLNALSGKDLNLNFGINLGKTNSVERQGIYGSKVRSETLPQLKKQAEALEDRIKEYYKVNDEYNAVLKLIRNSGNYKLGGDIQNLYTLMSGYKEKGGKASLAEQMDAYKSYINIIKEYSALDDKIKIENITSQFDKTADELIQDAQDVQTGAKEMEDSFEKLRQIFSGGNNINIDGISAQLDSIVTDLKEIKTALQGLSSGVSLDGLTQSFDRLSDTLEKLVSNVTLVKNALGDGLNTTVSNDGIEKTAQEQKELVQASTQSANAVVQAEEKKQQAYQQTANAIKQLNNADINVTTFADKGLDGTIDRVGELRKALRNVGFNDSSVDSITKDIDDLGVSVKEVTSQLKGNTITLTVKGLDQYERAVTVMKSFSPDKDGNFTVTNFSTSVTQSLKESEKFVKQQKKAVSDLTNQINQLNRAASDQNASRAIKNTSHLDSLKNKYDEITSAIQKMENASSDTFVDEQNNVKKLISEYKSLVSELKNAENVATSLRSKDIDTVKSTYSSKLDVLISDMKKAGVYTSGFEKGAENLRSVLSSATDASGLTNFLNGLDKLEAGYKRAAASAKEFNQSQKVGINVSGLESRIKDVQRISPEIDKFETEINGAKVSVQSLLNDLKQVNTQGDFSTVNAKFRAFADAAKEAGIAVTETAKKAKSISDIRIKLNDTGFNGFEQEVQRAHASAKELKSSSDDLEKALRRLDTAFDAMNLADEANDTKSLAAAYKEYEDALKQVGSQLKLQQQLEKDAFSSESLMHGKEGALLRLKGLFGDNSEAAKRFGAEVDRLQKEINECGSTKGLTDINRQISNLELKIKNANVQTQTFGQQLKAQFSKYSAYFGVAEVFMYAEQALRSMFEQVKLIDSAMTELKKVTNETDASYNQFLTNAASRAKALGTTIDGLVASTADFARLGYGFEEAQGLAEVANIYAVVGDEIDSVETATQSLISTLTAFKDEANSLSDSDFAMSIVDKMNEVSNNFAISSGGIGEALQRSASSMMAANNSLDETIALITAANTVVQDPESVGTAFKTMSMRIRGAKTELEEAGLETDGMAESTAKLRQEILALSGVDIMLNANEFKSTYQIMDELADKWQDLTDIQQASVTELIAGKRQGNIVSSLMSNFDIAEKALQTSLNSSGSAMREHEKWQQSLEAQINRLKASWQGLSQAFMSSDFLKGALNGIISLVDGLTKLIDTLGTFPTLMGTVAAGFSLFKNQGFAVFNKDTKSIEMFGTALTGLKDKYGQIKIACDRYNSVTSKSASFQKSYGEALASSSSSLGKYLSGLNGANASFKGYVKYLVSSKAATIGLQVATTALNTALTMGLSFAIQLVVEGIMKLINAKKELAEEVDELTSKFQEEHNSLMNLQGDFDTTNESSMISRYEKLSKGVDNLGRNVSLTSEEYTEYQSIVNSIADQIPSLISGYDEQGNALLSVKGNVEALTEAYQKLIHAQNLEILNNSGKIEEDFANVVKDNNKTGWWGALWDTEGSETLNGKHVDFLEELYENHLTDSEEIENLIHEHYDGKTGLFIQGKVGELARAFEDAGIEGIDYWNTSTSEMAEALAKAMEENPEKIAGLLGESLDVLEAKLDGMKSIAQAKLSEAFDVSNAISGLNYGNIGEDLQAVAYQVVNSLDYKFLSELSESGKTVEQWTTEMLNQFNAISKADNAEIEAAFDLQTQFNGGEVSYGEYVEKLRNVEEIINTLNLDDRAKEQLKISLGLDENGIIDQYDALIKRLTSEEYDFNVSVEEAESLLNGLTAEEYAVAVEVISEMSNNDVEETAEEIRTAIERELALQGISVKLNLEVETSKLEALSTAISESVSGAGLSETSISAVEGMFSGLNSYDPSKLFERTANGIRLNSDELRRLNSEYKNINIAELNKDMDSLGDIYNQTREELYRLTYGTDEYNDKARELSAIEQQINSLEKLAAGYKGVASAYQEWQMAESAGSQRDMYESLISGLENIDDEISRGWYDDATIEYLEILTGKDLSTAGIEEVKKAYKSLGKEIEHTSYSVRDFFTVDDEGNSTNAGVYNFLDAIGQMEEEKFGGKDVVQRDKKGNVIGFNFDLVGGDEVIAEALGVSEELVQIMVRAADDAGFVVSMDGTYQQLDILKEKAQEAAESLNRILENSGKKGFDFNFNTSDVEDIKTQLTEAKKILDTFRNTDGTINTKLEGADEALTVASTLQSMLDKLTRPAYMEIEVSSVEDELQEPLRNLQEYRRLVETLNQLKLSGADTSELEASIEESKNKIVDDLLEIQENNPKLAADLEIKGLTKEEIEKKVEAGEITIPATIDIQLEMDEKLGILVDKALLDAGIIDGKEFEKRVNIYLNADVNNEDAKSKTEQAVNEVAGNKGDGASSNGKTSDDKIEKNVEVEVKANKVHTSDLEEGIVEEVKTGAQGRLNGMGVDVDADVKVKAGEVDASDVKDKTEEAIKGEKSETLAVETKVELEATIDEALELIDKLEDKDVTINVTVEGLDDVKELNKNIDLATNIDGDIDNLSKYVENAKTLSELDDNISSFVTAEIKGNVLDKKPKELEKLKVFADGIKDLESGNIVSNVTANTLGNVFEEDEDSINNLKVFIDSAEGIKDIEGDFVSNITANTLGSVFEDDEEKINNLKTYINSAKGIKDIEGNITSNITANTLGSVFEGENGEGYIDNLKTYIESAKGIKDIEGNIVSNITANTLGSVFNDDEEKIDNLKIFAEGAKALQGVESKTVNITANTLGGVFENKNGEKYIDNLKVFADGAKALQDVNSKTVNITANTLGDVFDEGKEEISNLKTFAEGAKALQGAESKTVNITANVNGNVISGDGASGRLSSLTEFKSLVSGMSNQTVTVNVTANVDSANINSAIDLLTRVSQSGVFKDYNATVQVGATIATIDDTVVQNYKAPKKDGKVSYSVDENSPVYTWTAPKKTGTVNYSAEVEALTDAQKHKTGTITYKAIVEGGGVASGTAHANGTTSGRAFARGDWGIKGNGIALGGEVGRELVVRDGKFFTIGDNGAEFFRYKKNDIVFNAAQTESLFKYGGIKGANPRGKMFASGSAFSSGSVGAGKVSSSKKDKNTTVEKYEGYTLTTTKNSDGSTTKHYEFKPSYYGYDASSWDEVKGRSDEKPSSIFYNSKSSGSSSGSSGGSDEFEETFDWIEIAVDRIERVIDNLDRTVGNVYESWADRNEALLKQITEVENEIALQQQAYERYMAEAEKVGLDESWAKKVREGEIDITVLTDGGSSTSSKKSNVGTVQLTPVGGGSSSSSDTVKEKSANEILAEKIKEYQEWYEKALDCQDAIEELKQKESELYAQRVENVASQYEGILGVIEHEKNMLEEYINQSETQAWLVSANYYSALVNNEKENLEELENQKAEMINAFNDAMESGTIVEGSEGYYDLVNQIDEVTLAIAESETQLLEYQQTIQQLSWETFDLLQEKISSIVEETEFLIELMSSDKLFEDNGQLTNEGKATMGLHGVAYNIYMHQADQAVQEIERLKKELEKDPYDTELEERYREMIALQQEYILSAQDEKEAIRDLVSEGIEYELEALQELIDKKNEQLQSEKDLYEYSKKVKESTEEIASLEKQMAAYSNDNSEEAQQKIQQIKVELESAKEDLQETEYDKFINDSATLLDELYLEYETILNTRLDNLDYLIEQMIAEINSDASIIGGTIRETADSVGYTLTDSMKSIWDENSVSTKNVITTYGDKFLNAQTTTNNALNTINVNLQNMINQLNKIASTKTKSASASSVSKASKTNKTLMSQKPKVVNSGGGDGTPKIGDRVKFVSGQYYYDSQGKKPLGSHKQGEYVYITNINKKKWATHGYHISTGSKLGKGDLGWLKLNQLSGYATGKRNFLNDEVAWTQENGQEYIVRPSDGAILTPVAKGDSILTSAASNNIWDMANSPAEFIKDNLSFGTTNVPNNSNIQSNYTQVFDKVIFSLPNVKNYDELITSMKKDPNFERLIDSMTIGRLAGKSNLAKNKSIR